MTAVYEVLEVTPGEQWKSEHGTFQPYRLKLQGVDKPAHLNTKAGSAPPVAGTSMELDLQPHPKFDDALKAKKAYQGGGKHGGRSPEDEARTRRSIQMQHAQKCAVDALKLAAEFGAGSDAYKPPNAADVVNQIKTIAGSLYQQINEVAA